MALLEGRKDGRNPQAKNPSLHRWQTAVVGIMLVSGLLFCAGCNIQIIKGLLG
jgi:hypothetical protein